MAMLPHVRGDAAKAVAYVMDATRDRNDKDHEKWAVRFLRRLEDEGRIDEAGLRRLGGA